MDEKHLEEIYPESYEVHANDTILVEQMLTYCDNKYNTGIKYYV